jgi:hypothetical protein
MQHAIAVGGLVAFLRYVLVRTLATFDVRGIPFADCPPMPPAP